VLLVVSAPGASEADPLEGAEGRPKLELDVLPYAWISGTYASIAVDETTVRIEATPVDVLNLLFDGNAFSAAGYFSVSYDRVSLFADSVGGYMDVRASQSIPTQLCCTVTIDARTKMKFAVTDVGLGYRLGRWSLPGRRRPLTLGVFAGARYTYLSNEVDAAVGVVGAARRAANVYEGVAWPDPLVGIRWSAPLHDRISLDFRGDIGGFGANADITWGLVGTVRVWLPWTAFGSNPYLTAGYRAVAFERSNGATDVDMQLRGPLLGAGFTF
jgi:hypothetical protein